MYMQKILLKNFWCHRFALKSTMKWYNYSLCTCYHWNYIQDRRHLVLSKSVMYACGGYRRCSKTWESSRSSQTLWTVFHRREEDRMWPTLERVETINQVSKLKNWPITIYRYPLLLEKSRLLMSWIVSDSFSKWMSYGPVLPWLSQDHSSSGARGHIHHIIFGANGERIDQ